MARGCIEPFMRAFIARRKVEREAQEQSGQNDRHAVILGEPCGSSARDGRYGKPGDEARKRLPLYLARAGRCSVGEHHLAVQVAGKSLEIGGGPALHACSILLCLTVSYPYPAPPAFATIGRARSAEQACVFFRATDFGQQPLEPRQRHQIGRGGEHEQRHEA